MAKQFDVLFMLPLKIAHCYEFRLWVPKYFAQIFTFTGIFLPGPHKCEGISKSTDGGRVYPPGPS